MARAIQDAIRPHIKSMGSALLAVLRPPAGYPGPVDESKASGVARDQIESLAAFQGEARAFAFDADSRMRKGQVKVDGRRDMAHAPRLPPWRSVWYACL